MTTSALGEGDAATQAPAGPAGGVPETARATLRVNGREHVLDAGTRASLLEMLRDELGLTGTKVSYIAFHVPSMRRWASARWAFPKISMWRCTPARPMSIGLGADGSALSARR